MKKIYLFAAMAAMLASCSSDDLTVEKQAAAPEAAGDGAVVFDAYQSRGTTRAGLTGEMTNDQLQESEANKGGFGVFGYYTDGELYAGNSKPNFFYNQGVFYSSGPWVYSPVKYWPNEFGTDAISDQVDRVSFFAYAPYVQVDPLTGIVNGTGEKNTENITGMTRNNATGDPFIKYTATMDPTNTVDLCYGVAANNFTSSNSTTFPNKIDKGEPYLNLTKPGLDGIIKFDFKHALAKLNVQVDYDLDAISHNTSNELNAFTKIWVRSVIFEGITTKGALNLNNGEWYQIDASGDNKISSGTVTVYDGLKDGKEPVGTAANEIPATLKTTIIQSKPYNSAKLTPTETALQTTDNDNVYGVTKDPQNLFKSTNLTDPVYVIPTGEKMKVTIVYDVETYDKNLAYYLSDGVTPGSTIQNTITKTIDSFGEQLLPGKQYVLRLHLGMRTVQFDANVIGWEDIYQADADLPSNLPTYAVSNPTNVKDMVLAADAITYKFAVSGLTVNTTPGKAGSFAGTVTPGQANASGVAIVDLTGITANDDTKIKDLKDVIIKDATHTDDQVQIKFKQAPQPLNLGLNDIAKDATTLTFTVNPAISSNTAINKANVIANGGTLKLYKNGVDITSAPGVTLSDSGLTITIPAAAEGDVYTLYIQSGDATAESVTKTVPVTTP